MTTLIVRATTTLLLASAIATTSMAAFAQGDINMEIMTVVGAVKTAQGSSVNNETIPADQLQREQNLQAMPTVEE
ncbi:MAG: hypothetical protein COA42_17970 [Alteromonadaceae bacterium]|nr:MAG: hypothetical protein COA42_17970 [Alteromonadaceae bacterium]